MTTIAPESGFYLYEALDAMKATCGVDLRGIGLKLSVQLLGADGLLQLPTDEQQTTPAQQAALWNPVMEALAPEHEMQCNNTQYNQFRHAMENFQSCTGLSATSTNDNNTTTTSPHTNKANVSTSELLHNIGNHCQLSSLLANRANCTEALLSDDRTLYTLRDVYQHTSKYCQCSSILRHDLPSCFVTVADLINHTTTSNTTDNNNNNNNTTIDGAYQKMKFSLGFLQSTMLCGIDLGCKSMTQWCLSDLNDLKRCLQEDTATKCQTGNMSSSACQDSDLFNLPPQLTQGMLPDVCLNALKDHKINDTVVDEFSNYVERCHPSALADHYHASTSSSAQLQQHATFDSRNNISNDGSGWMLKVVLIGFTGVMLVSSVAILKMGWWRRHHRRKRRFHPDDAVEQQELHEFGLQSLS